MRRVLVLSAFTLGLAGMAFAQQTGGQAYWESGQYGQSGGQYSPYSEQYSPYGSQYSQYGGQFGGQSSPYTEQYSGYGIQRGQYGAQYGPQSWGDYGSGQYGQMGTFEGTGGQFTGQDYSRGMGRPYGFAGYGTTWGQSGWTPDQQQGAYSSWQYGPQQQQQRGPWQQGQQAGMYGAPGFEQAGQQQAFGGMGSGQGQRLRVVGSIEQHIPAQQFSNELNPNDVLVKVRTLNGREQLVDLGPNAETANFAPNPGSRVMVSGHIVFLNGQPVLIAQRAHEIGSGAFQQAGFGERGTRFRQSWSGRAGSWQQQDRDQSGSGWW